MGLNKHRDNYIKFTFRMEWVGEVDGGEGGQYEEMRSGSGSASFFSLRFSFRLISIMADS